MLNMKKIVLLAFFCLFFASVLADSITNLATNSPIYLDKKLIVSGSFDAPNVLCKFITTDLNGTPIFRATDEYTFSDNSFYSEIQTNDNLYKVNSDYNLSVSCGTANQTITFKVLNREPIFEKTATWWEFAFDKPNYLTIAIVGICIAIGLFFYEAWKKGVKLFGR